MGCLIVLISVLILVMFWKQILELIVVSVFVGSCYVVPSCRDNILPLIRAWGHSLLVHPIESLLLSSIAVVVIYVACQRIANALYQRFAPDHIRFRYPTLHALKTDIKRTWRDR